MNQSEVLSYYSRDDIQRAMLKFSKDKEVVGSLENGSYLSRPDIILYPKDIVERVRKGVVAFHCSVENWTNPMQLSTSLNQKEMENLRKGFDFIIDIDSKMKLSHALAAADVICKFISDLGVKASVKFSGRRGVHIGVSSNAFPEVIDFRRIGSRYPEFPQAMAEFVKEKVKDQILEELIAIEGGVASLVSTMPSVSELSPYAFIELERGWGNRHLFRMPYSLHPAQWLVSVPIEPSRISKFNTDEAKPESVKTNVEFLSNREGEATEFLLQALDWKSRQPKEAIREAVIKPKYTEVVPEEYFPPCMKLIIDGLKDGKKRSLFTLITYLRNMNWTQEEIEKKVREWNGKNSTPLTERFISTQLKWHFRQSRMLMPANCNSELFYDSMGICKPDAICQAKAIKNPVKYPYRLMRKR